MRLRSLLIVSVFSLLFVATATTTKAQSIGKDTLQGLKGIYVLVEALDGDVEQNGLTENQILTDTELRLRKAGIRVPQEASSFGSDVGTLFIRVATKQGSDGLYAFHISVDLAQMVYLVRTPSKKIPATTYIVAGTVGTVGANRIKDIRGSVGDDVDTFINDYLAANPK